MDFKVQVDKVSKYQHIAKVEQYVEHRALQADGLVEVTKINCRHNAARHQITYR